MEINLNDLPERMRSLRLDSQRGIPVPWFVHWIDGRPEFRVMDADKWNSAVRRRLCWVCGQRLGTHLAFVLGPMCGITRTTQEPPCHLDCARWSARNCPFLARPHMVRRDDEELIKRGATVVGEAILRNPGVALIWITRGYEVWSPDTGGRLITVGEPESIECYAEGRRATREEVEESIRTGLPFLEAAAEKQQGGMAELRKQTTVFQRLLLFQWWSEFERGQP